MVGTIITAEYTMKITNKNYRQFIDNGIIDLITIEHIKKAIENIEKEKNPIQKKIFLLLLYYTGARPNEVLKLKSKDITKEKNYIKIQLKGSKRGLPRPIFLSNRLPYFNEIWSFCSSFFPEVVIFYNFKNKYVRIKKNIKGETIENIETTDKIRYYINKWFKNVVDGSISPYFLRHSRFSQLSLNGAKPEEIMQLKGSKSLSSVRYYIHLNKSKAIAISRKIK